MDENKINEAASALEETTEAAETVAENVDEINEEAETVAENAEEISEEAEPIDDNIEEITEETETAAENVEETGEETEAIAENAVDSIETEASVEEPAEKKKKKFPIQIPVIIAACIVIIALLGYFVVTGFFLREPEGVTWSQELEGATYYFEFCNNNVFKAYVGSVEIESTYQKEKAETGNTLTIGTNVCNFYSGYPATYEITGSRILGNQTMSYSYGEGADYTLVQASRKTADLKLPENFEADPDLLGTWVFQYFGYDVYRVTFNDNGSLKLEFLQDGITYNGTYTLEDDGVMNFTYYVSDNVATQLDYSVNGDTLNFLGATFVREGSNATVDQALQTPVDGTEN